MQSSRRFAHERLQVYPILKEALRSVAGVFSGAPRGEGDLVRQAKRAGDSALLNLCEGAARTSARDKANFYDISAASAAECAGAVDLLEIRVPGVEHDAEAAREGLRRAAAMLNGLAVGARGRAGGR